MSAKFKSRRKLKRKYSFILLLVVSVPLVIFMQKHNILKPLYKKSMNNLFINNKNLKTKIATAVFQNSNIDLENKISVYKPSKKNDEIFTIKEEKNNQPIVYLYNTHQGEKYKPFDGSDFTPNIITATSYLKEILNKAGINTIMETRSVSKILDENKWSYGSSYRVSRSFIDSTISSNPSIKYLFDIHRDSGTHNYTTLCVNDKCYAKILFLIGLENANYLENQKYVEELSLRLNSKLNGISKGILQKQGPRVNGVYNQDFSNRTILIELGGENNTLDEVYNTINILAEVIIEFIKEEM